MSERIVGRDRELALIRRALDDTGAGTGGCQVIVGPPGIGKSRLLRAAGDLADERDIAVAAREAFKHDLAAPLVTLAGALRACSPPTGEFAWLAGPDERDGGNYARIHRLRASLERYAAVRPLLIVIDDAHWMDELSALAVRELVPALDSSPVRWLLAGRAQQTDAPGWQTLRWLTRRGATTLDLDVLDDDATARLAADVIGARVDNTVLALVAGCGGNPLRIEQLLGALLSTDQIMVTDGIATVVGEDLPSSFVAEVQEIIGSLPEDARWLLRATSVLDRPFGIEAAARLMGREPADLFTAIDEVTAAGVLTEAPEGLAFRHDLVRQAVQSTLRTALSQHLHREAAVIAREEGRATSEIADHLLRSGRAGTGAAVTLLRDTAAEVADTSPATAADLMLQALAAIGEHDPARPAVIAGTVGLLASAARVGRAQELGREALRAGLDLETEAVLRLGLAEASKHAGQNAAAVRYADDGLRQPSILESTRARLHAVRAHAAFYQDDFAGADRSGAEADRIGREHEPGAAVFGLTARSLVAQAEGRYADALAHATAATALADTARGPARHRNPRIWLTSALTTLDRFDEAQAVLERGRQESENLGTAWAQPLWHYYAAWLLTARGRLDDAVAEADAGVAVAEQLTAYQLAVPLLGTLTRLALLRGEPEQAKDCLDRMRELTATGITAAPEDVVWPEAAYLAAEGSTDAAFAMLTGLYDAMPARPTLIGQDPGTAAVMVGLARTAGDRARAETIVTAARDLARRNPGSHSAAGAAAHAAAMLHDDRRHLATAIDQFRLAGRPLPLAAALLDAVTLGDSSSYEEAAAIVTATGAHGLRRRPEPAAAQPAVRLPQLTAAERSVALLIAQGLTNTTAAARLHVSPHTVDSHLRKIFMKLGIHSRVELATVVARESPR